MKTYSIKLILICISILTIVLLVLPGIAGCSLNNLLRASYSSGSTLELRNIQIDESEVESIMTLSERMEKSYDISREISSIADELEDPFKPFYIGEETDIAKNILILENIYSEGDTDYCEILFNDFAYILALDDTFNNMYMVQAINESSVVLLKGDEVLTLFIGEMVSD